MLSGVIRAWGGDLDFVIALGLGFEGGGDLRIWLDIGFLLFHVDWFKLCLLL